VHGVRPGGFVGSKPEFVRCWEREGGEFRGKNVGWSRRELERSERVKDVDNVGRPVVKRWGM
jgi:hypothetical protein